MMISTRSILAATAMVCLGSVASLAADRPAPSDIWKIEMGQPISAIPPGFADFACGTNGGPPGTKLAGFADFARCAAEASGWHEVYFRYDDELEYWAKANNESLLQAWTGTKAYNFPVVVSVLIDDAGIVQGLRLVSDPTDDSIPRDSARFLHPFLVSRFKPADHPWSCQNLPPAGGETAVGGEFWKEDCAVDNDGRHYELRVRYLRRPGQGDYDPHSGRMTDGQFESSVWFEVHLQK